MTGQIESVNHITESNRAAGWKYVMKGKALDRVLAAMQRSRKIWESKTAPWLDGGYRICSSSRVVETKTAIETAIREVESAVEDLVSDRDRIVMHDRAVLNGAFNECDYPTAQELRGRFAIRIKVWPVPTDFRTEGIDGSLVSELQNETARQFAEAKRDLLERVETKVSALLTAIPDAGNKGKRFHGEAFAKAIAQTCSDAREANFDDDPAINDLLSRVADTVSRLDSDAIRESAEVKNDAQAIVEKQLAEVQAAMSGFVL